MCVLLTLLMLPLLNVFFAVCVAAVDRFWRCAALGRGNVADIDDADDDDANDIVGTVAAEMPPAAPSPGFVLLWLGFCIVSWSGDLF